jgi:hypothetical protein
MARTRELIRELYQHIVLECEERVHGHGCGRYCDHNSRCIVCAAAQPKYALAYTSISREKELLNEEPLAAEVALLNVIGEEQFNRKLHDQKRKFLSGPETICRQCGVRLKVYGSYAENFYQAVRRGTLNIPCNKCGVGTRLSWKSMKTPKGFNASKIPPLEAGIPIRDPQAIRATRAEPERIRIPDATAQTITYTFTEGTNTNWAAPARTPEPPPAGVRDITQEEADLAFDGEYIAEMDAERRAQREIDEANLLEDREINEANRLEDEGPF